MNRDANASQSGSAWPREGDRLFVVAEDAENNAWLKWRGDERWLAYAEGYKKAADILVEQVKETASDQDFLVYPIAFLYRHYLELCLKGLIITGWQLRKERQGFPQHHKIWELWQEARAVLEEVWPCGSKADLDNIGACIGEFASLDPLSVTFRYPVTKNGKETLPDVTHINLRNLSEVMGRLAGLLDSAYCAILEMLRIRREAEKYLGQ